MEVVFLAYANSETAPLPALKEEARHVYDLFSKKSRETNFFPFYEPFSSIERINTKLADCEGQISIFLYSGHAGSTKILLNDKLANATGIALHLKKSVDSGSLKLVVLNGCSTKDQVRALLDIGVPAIIATQARIDDISAGEFAKILFYDICERGMTIKESFLDALAAAQLASKTDLRNKTVRDVDFLEKYDEQMPLWELFAANERSTEINPLPKRTQLSRPEYKPNEALLKTLYTTFYNAGNPSTVRLWKREKEIAENIRMGIPQTEIVDKGMKQHSIINSIPRPIGLQLQKLLCPDDNAGSTIKVSINRFNQLTQLFFISLEFLGFIMIAQLWEVCIQHEKLKLPDTLRNHLKNYFNKKFSERDVFNYSTLIIEIRNFLNDKNLPPEVKKFISGQKIIQDFNSIKEDVFTDVSKHLLNFRIDTYNKTVREENVETSYMSAEKYLCDFFSLLGFIHRYKLTSIHSIDILKHRHLLKSKVRYRHRIFSLMQTFGTDEDLFYFMPTYLDNYGVILISGELKVLDQEKKYFEADATLDFLNLSPFVIDWNAFEKNSTLSRLMFFHQQLGDGSYDYKDVRKPDKHDDKETIHQEKYEGLLLEFMAFRTGMLGEPIQQNLLTP